MPQVRRPETLFFRWPTDSTQHATAGRRATKAACGRDCLTGMLDRSETICVNDCAEHVSSSSGECPVRCCGESACTVHPASLDRMDHRSMHARAGTSHHLAQFCPCHMELRFCRQSGPETLSQTISPDMLRSRAGESSAREDRRASAARTTQKPAAPLSHASALALAALRAFGARATCRLPCGPDGHSGRRHSCAGK